ncbi:MAG: hypothetical protein WC680_08505 [Sulfuricurvum sp.]|jgi:hypothetical protein
MKPFHLLVLLCLIVLSAHALEPFQEQTPLPMSAPNVTKEKQPKWIPLETPTKSTKISNKTIDESIKTQIQKKMQTLLKPLKDEEEER